MQALHRCIRRKGYAFTSLRDLAEEADMSASHWSMRQIAIYSIQCSVGRRLIGPYLLWQISLGGIGSIAR